MVINQVISEPARYFRIILLAVVASLCVLPAEDAVAATAGEGVPSPAGVWINDKKTVAVRVYSCDHSEDLCGKIVWLKKPYRRSGELKQVDGQPFCGLQVLIDFRPSGPARWSEGVIFDAAKDTYYKGIVEMAGPDTLKVRGYLLLPLLGKTLNWRRIDGPPGLCPTRREVPSRLSQKTGLGLPRP